MQPHLPLTLGDDLERNAERYPDELAFVYGDCRLTHAQCLHRARQLGAAWHKLGMRRQDRISVLAQNCLEFLEIYSAGEWAGYITATVNFRLAPPEMRHVINDTAPKVLVFEAAYSQAIAGIKEQLGSIEHFVCIAGNADQVPSWASSYSAVIDAGSASGPPYRSRESDIAYLIYTSGTTGRPKGCILGQREARAWAQGLALANQTTPADRMLLMMPLFHIGAKFVQNSQHVCGGTVHIQRGFQVEAVLPCISEHRITTTLMAPTMVQTLLESPRLTDFDLSSLRTIVYGAAPMPVPVLKKGLSLFGPVFIQTYGQTETTGATLGRHQHCPDGTDRQQKWLQSVGHPYLDTQLRIVDDEGNECASGKLGEITIRSSAQFRGYWNNSVATAETLRDGWVHTGDIGRIDDEGFLYLIDRKKDVIISGGENIYSREVEEALALHPAVSECAVIGVPDEKWGEAVCAIVVLRAGHTAVAADLVEHCKQFIAGYKKPKHVVFMESIPKLPSGKTSKVELRKQYAQGSSSQ